MCCTSTEARRCCTTTASSQDRKSTRLNSSHSSISYTLFFFNDTATTEIYPLSLHDALPISLRAIDRDNKCVVRARRLDDVVQRLLRLNVLLLLQYCTRDRFDVGKRRFSTFGMFSVFEFQGAEDVCYDCFEVLICGD